MDEDNSYTYNIVLLSKIGSEHGIYVYITIILIVKFNLLCFNEHIYLYM